MQSKINFERIQTAIQYLQTHFKNQPNLEELAEHVHLSPFHFQRLFTEWAGVSPKKFQQYLSLNYCKSVLKTKSTSLFDAAQEAGLSGTGRLHDLFVKIEGMTPGEYKNGGAALKINYQYHESPFGELIIASTARGICYLAFVEDKSEGLKSLQFSFPKASLSEQSDQLQAAALKVFQLNWNQPDEIKLHLKGSSFQLKVWEALLKIPFAHLCSYKTIAENIEQAGASRAVGSAIASNSIAFLIPCHRVIQGKGHFGNYRWGPNRKLAMIGWEAAKK